MLRLFPLVIIVALLPLPTMAAGQEPAQRVLVAVFAHADDELDVAPMLSLYATRGHLVHLVFATRGEKGTSDHAGVPAGDSLAAVRREEARCAAEALGIEPPVLLGMNDGSLVDRQRELHVRLDSLFRALQPDVVVTWGPDGGYGHPDHRMVHAVVTEWHQTGLREKPTQLYFTGIPTQHWTIAPTASTELGRWLAREWKPVDMRYLTTRITYGQEHEDRALRSYACYRSQFTDVEMQDNVAWLKHMNQGTVYLRPFAADSRIRRELFAPVPARSVSDAAFADSIIALGEEWTEAWNELDPERLLRLHTDDLLYGWRSGFMTRESFEHVLHEYIIGHTAYSLELAEPSVRRLGADAAVLSFLLVGEEVTEGATRPFKAAVTLVLERRSGEWTIVQIHDSEDPPETHEES